MIPKLDRSTAPVPIVQRAYELARSGECSSINDVCQRLRREGYTEVALYFDGATIRADLSKLCSESHKR